MRHMSAQKFSPESRIHFPLGTQLFLFLYQCLYVRGYAKAHRYMAFKFAHQCTCKYGCLQMNAKVFNVTQDCEYLIT